MQDEERSALSEDIALELALLEDVLPGPEHRRGEVIDLRGQSALLTASSSSNLFSHDTAAMIQRSLLPLLFGVAWKILDLIIERVWHAEGRRGRISIEAKCRRTQGNRGSDFTALVGDLEIGERTGMVYAASVELRHTLAHRRTRWSAIEGLTDEQGQTLSSQEIHALCQLAILTGRAAEMPLDDRSRAHAAWWANELSTMHGLPSLSFAHSPRPMDVVKVLAARGPQGWIIDTERAMAKAIATNSGYPFAHLEVHAPADEFEPRRSLLHEAPRGVAVPFNPDGDPWR